VRQVLPRFMNFPNQHRLALLERMTQAEADIIDEPGFAGSDLSFPSTAEIYHAIADVPGNTFSGETPAQLAATELTHHADSNTDTWFLFPIAAWDLFTNVNEVDINEPAQFDLLKITWPTVGGIAHWYFCNNVEPRRLGFSDEHLGCCAGPLDLNSILFWIAEIDPAESSIVADPDEIPDDDTTTSTITVTYKDENGNPLANRPVTITTTGAGTIDDPTGITDDDGIYETTYHSGTNEECTFSTDDIGPSNVLTVGPPLPPETWVLTVGTTTNGTCSDCADLSEAGPFSLSETMADTEWWSTAIGFNCDTGPNLEMKYRLTKSGDVLTVTAVTDTLSFDMATFTGTYAGWNGVDPITLTFDSDDGRCNWPGTITIEPA